MRAGCSNQTVHRLPDLGEAIFAEELKDRDCLFVYSEVSLCRSRIIFQNQWEIERIAHISSIRQNGVYSPLTENGKILVNGILTSCYSNVKNSQLQNTFFEVRVDSLMLI